MCHSAERWVHCDVFLNVNGSAGRAQAADSFRGYDLPLKRKKKKNRIILSETISTHAKLFTRNHSARCQIPCQVQRGKW